ncbi:MAG: hypothetical protein VYB44_07160 [Bacteroidota bacterium]|nr:hypothetical protein [Bacteroidota bacterium]
MKAIWKKEFEGETIQEFGIIYKNYPVPKKRRWKPYCYLPVEGDPDDLFRLRFVIDTDISKLCNVLIDAMKGRFLKSPPKSKNYTIKFKKYGKLLRIADHYGFSPYGDVDTDIVFDTVNGEITIDGVEIPLIMTSHNHLFQVIYRYLKAKWSGKEDAEIFQIIEYVREKGF